MFNDKLGQTVLTSAMEGSEQNDTYCVYDNFGNLRYVLSPLAADTLATAATWDDTNAALKNYAYIYKYDSRKRCIQKKLPGVDAITMKYDNADRLIFSQDGNQKAKMPYAVVSGYDVQHTSAKGLLTGTRTYQANDPAKYTISALYYDYRGRGIHLRCQRQPEKRLQQKSECK